MLKKPSNSPKITFMKKISLLLIFIFSLTLTYGQTSSNGDEDVKIYIDGESNLNYATFKETVVTKGNVYLFPKWVDNAKLYTRSNKKYVITGLNYNLKKDNFEIKMPNDSVFILDGNHIDHLNIQGSIFKKENIEKTGNEFYEVLLKDSKISLYKKHKVRLIPGKMHPLNGTQEPHRYHKYYEYYVIQNDKPSKIALRKKHITSLVQDKLDLVKDYTKRNKLSYKSEKDVVKLLKYYKTL